MKMNSSDQDQSSGMDGGKITMAILVVLALAASVAAYYFYAKLAEFKKDPQKIIQSEVMAVLDKIDKIMVLPEGEQPTLATVTDPAKLKDQPFFAKAKVGDKVLLYASARKAILYDPIMNKIVEVAPISIGNPTPPGPPPTPAPTPAPNNP